MRLTPFLSIIATACLALAVHPSSAVGQTDGYPTISARSYTGGSATVSVKGAGGFDQEVPINAQASFSDGEKTWLQFGASGAPTPNVLITYGDGEVGVSVGRGKFIVTTGIAPGEPPQCKGGTTVTGASVDGQYTCPGVVSYDAGSGKMGKVDVEVRFSAKS